MAGLRWIEPEPKNEAPPGVAAALLRKALAQRPDSADLHAKLGCACVRLNDYRAAAEAFEAAVTRDPASFPHWPALAGCYLKLDRPADALAACERSASLHENSALICLRRGVALQRLGRELEARAEFERCVALGDHELVGLHTLLLPLAQQPDGGELLEYCNALPLELQDTALVRANRAIALSRLGRVAEARSLVDLDRHVARVPLVPPPKFGNPVEFNARLATDMLALSGRVGGDRREAHILYHPETRRSAALSALLLMIREAIERYLDEAPDRGLDSALPPPPEAATLFNGVTVLRGDGTNGEHIHPEAYVSTVYHVAVPAEIATAEDDRGALTLGDCTSYTGGYQGIWGTRQIRPMTGWLTLFPSHVFHNVVPTRSDAPRIAVAADLRPIRP
jgi:tetratricopeptide (TPR) repeat protein